MGVKRTKGDTRTLTLFALPEPIIAEPATKQLRHPVWTEKKAVLIQRYLYYFVLVTKGVAPLTVELES